MAVITTQLVCTATTPCAGLVMPEPCCGKPVCAGHQKAHQAACSELKDIIDLDREIFWEVDL